MPKRETMDEIYDSLINGQHKQAIEQVKAMGTQHMPELMDYFEVELDQPETALQIAKLFFKLTY